MENTSFQPVMPRDPSVSGAFGMGWETLKRFFPELLLILLLQLVVSLPVGLGQIIFYPTFVGEFYNGLFNVLYGFIVLFPVSYGTSWVYLKAVRGESFRATDIFFGFQRFGNVILAGILMGVIIGLGFVFLVIPGIIFACKLAFVPYLVMDEKLEATEAIRRSWSMTRGHSGTIFLMGLTSFLIILLGIICLIVGVIPAIMWISVSFAAFYYSVSTQQRNLHQSH